MNETRSHRLFERQCVRHLYVIDSFVAGSTWTWSSITCLGELPLPSSGSQCGGFQIESKVLTVGRFDLNPATGPRAPVRADLRTTRARWASRAYLTALTTSTAEASAPLHPATLRTTGWETASHLIQFHQVQVRITRLWSVTLAYVVSFSLVLEKRVNIV